MAVCREISLDVEISFGRGFTLSGGAASGNRFSVSVDVRDFGVKSGVCLSNVFNVFDYTILGM